MSQPFKPVAAKPYPWPFDGIWSAKDTALLLLGYQAETIAVLDAIEETRKAATLAAAAWRAGIPVMAARRGTQPVALELNLHAGDPLFEYNGDNAFYGTGLEAALRRAGIRNLILAGLPTDGLLHASMRTANDMGFECLAVADACKGTSTARHNAQLRITTFGNGLFGTVADLSVLLAALPTE